MVVALFHFRSTCAIFAQSSGVLSGAPFIVTYPSKELAGPTRDGSCRNRRPGSLRTLAGSTACTVYQGPECLLGGTTGYLEIVYPADSLYYKHAVARSIYPYNTRHRDSACGHWYRSDHKTHPTA